MVVWKWTTGNIISKLVIYYDNQLSKARWSLVRKFWTVKIRIFSQTTFLVSNGNNIVASNFARFAANDVKGRQTVIGNGAKLNVKGQHLRTH